MSIIHMEIYPTSCLHKEQMYIFSQPTPIIYLSHMS